jgi:hypothetical protein
MESFVQAVRQLARKHYTTSYGWSVIEECWTDKEIFKRSPSISSILQKKSWLTLLILQISIQKGTKKLEQKSFNMTEEETLVRQTVYDVKCTVTTLFIKGDPYYVYEYDNDVFLDIVVRGPTGHRIEETNPMFRVVGEAYTDSTPVS